MADKKHLLGYGSLGTIVAIIAGLQAFQWFNNNYEPHAIAIAAQQRVKTLEDYYREDRAAREAVEQYQQAQQAPRYEQQRDYAPEYYYPHQQDYPDPVNREKYYYE